MSDNPSVVQPGHQTSPSSRSLLIWRIVAPLTYIIFVISAVYHTFVKPHDEHEYKHHHYRNIWRQNGAHNSPFSLNAIITSIYWIIVWFLQLGYLFNLFAPNHTIAAATSLAPAFSLNNVLSSIFVGLWTREFFWWALLVAIINWLNLTFAYFKWPRHPALMHAGVLAGPLAFAFVALFWDGAAAVGAHKVAARIVANVFVWSWLVYGGFYLVIFKDWAVGLSLSVLTASLSVHQFLLVVFSLQWIFGFTIMALLFIASVVVALPETTGFTFRRGAIVSEDRERAPLLADDAA